MSKELSLFSTDKKVPSFLTDAGNSAGNEAVTLDDIAVPQLKILQPLSPELMMGIPNAKPGLFINSATHDVFETIHVVNMMYEHNYVIFKTRDAGGGKVAQAKTRTEAKEQIDAMPGSPMDYQLVDTGVHSLLGLAPDGTPGSPLIFYCSSTRKLTSDAWNTQLQLRCQEFSVPRYASVWELAVTTLSNNKGTWYGFRPTFAGLIQDAGLFETISTMRAGLEQKEDWVPMIASS
jgi:hypothetical protein